MANFQYKATDKNKKIIKGQISANNKQDAASLLKSKNFSIISIQEMKKPSQISIGKKKVSTVEKATFCRYLSTMIAAGLPLSEAIDILSSDTSNSTMYKILNSIQYDLQAGRPLSTTFKKYPQVFDQTFISITRAGEKSGTLSKSFNYLGSQLQAAHQLKQKIKNALMYPIVVIMAMGAVGTLMVTFVLPRIGNIFTRLNVSLPLPTLLLLKASIIIQKYSGLLAILGIISLGLSIISLKSTKGKRFITLIGSKTPYLKQLLTQIDLSRFFLTLSTLLSAGVPIIEALEVATASLAQPQFKQLGGILNKEISKGISLSDVLAKQKKLFPQLTIRMIKAGEKTGALDKILLDLAKFYEQETESALKSFTNILEPVLMLAIGIAVGAMVISIIAPIYGIIQSLESPG